MEEFLSKVVGGKEVGAIITLDNSHAHKVEVILKDKEFLILNNIKEIANELRVANSIAIPLYRLENEDEIYNLVMGYASGQISLTENNKTVFINPKYTSITLLILVTHDFLNKSKYNWLSIAGLAYQAE